MAKSAPKFFTSHLPSVNQQRTLFDMSKTDTVTINPDYYYPNYNLLVIPGDTIVLEYSNVIRLLDALQVPMMDNLYCDTHWWYVPFDIVWDYTKNFFGEKKRPSDPDITTLPTVEFTGSNDLPQVGSVYDYFGIPIEGYDTASNQPLLTGAFSINALPLMSYYLIHDDWVRDEQRQNYLLDTPDFTKQTFSPSDFTLYKRGKRFDYFTSTLLNPTGNSTPTVLNIGGFAPISAYDITGTNPSFTRVPPQSSIGTLFESANEGSLGQLRQNLALCRGDNLSPSIGSTIDGMSNTKFFTASGQGPVISGTAVPGDGIVPVNLYANLQNATGVSVDDLRRAFQVQAYNETIARYGERYPEYIYGLYGTIAPESMMYRPEFLGSTHQRLSTQPIVQTTGTTNAPLGDLGAIVTGGVSKPVFTRSFSKFGYVIGCINIYSDLTYFQGLEKHWKLRDRMDFPVSIFANLTDQPVYKDEIVLTGTSSDKEVFGYSEIYAWAKYSQNTLRGLVRPNAPQSIGQWSLAEKFSSVPVNDDTFITSTTPIDRVTAVASDENNVHHFIVNQKIDVKLTRELPAHSDPMKWMFRS